MAGVEKVQIMGECDVKQYTHLSFVLIGSFNCVRVKPPLRAVLQINLLGKGLTPRHSTGDEGILLMGSCVH